MNCLHPVDVRITRKDGTLIPALVPCGKCYACQYNDRVGWSYRATLESNSSKYSLFVTLTYNNLHLDKLTHNGKSYGVVSRETLQKFFKRCRKRGLKFSYIFVSEYGPLTNRPHYHGIFFLHQDNTFELDDIIEKISKSWNLGFSKISEVTPARINYVTGYSFKECNPKFSFQTPTFRLMSRRPAIGYDLLADEQFKNISNHIANGGNSLRFGSASIPIPKYYKNKLRKEHTNDELFNIYNSQITRQNLRTKKLFEYFQSKYPKLSPSRIYSLIYSDDDTNLRLKRQALKNIYKNLKNNEDNFN
ncbi:replication initiator protein [Capybara microvirus Cap1_SP_127]|nr:replication initiator protein [Capybara microvirus Cap1_SP_127]